MALDMTRWFRAYDDAVDDPKLQRLPGDTFKALFNLWCLTSKNDGVLPPIDEIAFKLRMRVEKVQRLLDTLQSAKLIESDETGMHPHNWNARQFKSDVSNERVKRHRERQRNVTSTATETPPETESDTEPETESSSLRSEVVRAPAAERGQFDQFWKAFPNKVGKRSAYKAFATAMKSGAVTFDRMMFALESYVNKADDRPWCNPSTWLNQGRWDDQPAAGVPRHGRDESKSVLAAADRLIDKLGGMEAARAYVPGSSGPAPLRLDFGEGKAGVRLIPKG